jgi:amino acid permease
MSILSSIIGCGLISIPYAANLTGMSIFLLTNTSCILFMAIAAAMFLRVRENMLKLNSDNNMREISISQITSHLLGRSSVLFYNVFVGFALFGVNVLFFLFFT